MQYGEEREAALMCDLCHKRLNDDEAPALAWLGPLDAF